MTNYDFYIAQLRFVATRTARESDEVACSVDALLQLADDIAQGSGIFFVPANSLRINARALAGFAGFLQQHILPEVVAAGNAAGEKQVRWSIEASMAMMAQLTTHAELTHDAQDLSVTLPPVS